jgi:ABC-type uncharacterized transport system involved in gliding motility auxiliary subunit
MNTSFLKARQTKFTAYATLYILIVMAVLGFINWFANKHNKSVDSTSSKQFSLSDQTKKIVTNLKQDVKISYFDKTKEFQRAKDLLDRYNNLSPKLTVDYVDPDKKPALAKAAGIRTYGTTTVDGGAKHQEAKALTEEEITGAIIRTQKTGERNVCAVTGSGEHSFDEPGRQGYSQLKEITEKNNYKTRSISLLDKPEVPKDCTIVLVGGPRFDYVQPVADALKTYVESGGHAIFLVDPPVKLGKENVSDNPALINLLASWGVTANKDLVLDTSGLGQLFQLSEVVPLVSTYESHPIVAPLKGVATAFPLARSLDIKNAEKTTVAKLFSTSENSYATTNLSSPQIQINPAKDKKGPLLLAAAGNYNPGPPAGQGRFVVVGSSGWVANSILGFNGNADLYLNMLNWLSADEDLISIRPKDPEDRRLNLSSRQASMLFYTSVLMIPLMVILAGFGMWWRRR